MWTKYGYGCHEREAAEQRQVRAARLLADPSTCTSSLPRAAMHLQLSKNLLHLIRVKTDPEYRPIQVHNVVSHSSNIRIREYVLASWTTLDSQMAQESTKERDRSECGDSEKPVRGLH